MQLPHGRRSGIWGAHCASGMTSASAAFPGTPTLLPTSCGMLRGKRRWTPRSRRCGASSPAEARAPAATTRTSRRWRAPQPCATCTPVGAPRGRPRAFPLHAQPPLHHFLPPAEPCCARNVPLTRTGAAGAAAPPAPARGRPLTTVPLLSSGTGYAEGLLSITVDAARFAKAKGLDGGASGAPSCMLCRACLYAGPGPVHFCCWSGGQCSVC